MKNKIEQDKEIEFFDKPLRSRNEKEKLVQDEKRLEKMGSDYESFGFDYFDNKSLGVGYQGYKYDERYESAVKKMINYYGLKQGSKVLELGCAKGYILVEFKKQGMDVTGLDISKYAVSRAHPEVIDNILVCDVTKCLPFRNSYFDLIISKELFPHISEGKIEFVIKEIMRCSKNTFAEIQCAGENRENLYKWDKTHKILWNTQEWKDFLKKVGYNGHYHLKILV